MRYAYALFLAINLGLLINNILLSNTSNIIFNMIGVTFSVLGLVEEYKGKK